MKTIEQWLNTLKEPYKTKALNNLLNDCKDNKTQTLEEALKLAFTWANSDEGFLYWDELHTKILCSQED